MKWSVVVAVHKDESVLESTLMRSPALGSATRVTCQRGFASVAQAYNAALRESDDDLILFAHPDVYFPKQWSDALERTLAWLQVNDPNWGVLGLWGVSPENRGCGFVYSTGLRGFIGTPFSAPKEVSTVDEFAFLIRTRAGLVFDEAIPSAQFQLGATDLCLEARRRGLRCYAIPCFALHNSNGWSHLPLSFWPCYLYIRKKWNSLLPIDTPYARITRSCMPLIRQSARGLLARRKHRRETRVKDPSALYEGFRAELFQAFE
jgi:hypothetical protein